MFETIMLVVNDSTKAKDTAIYIRGLVQNDHTRVIVVQIIEPSSWYLSGTLDINCFSEHNNGCEMAELIMDELAVTCLSTNVEILSEPVIGSILEGAIKFKPDLIVNG